MAGFNIKRGDTMPPLIISMRIAGTDPEEYYDFEKDDVGAGGASSVDNAVLAGTTVKFTMKNATTGEVIGLPANAAQGFTGYGEIYQDAILDPLGGPGTVNKTLLRYNWQQPDLAYDPAAPSALVYAGDTGKAGLFTCEFEVLYAGTGGSVKPRKRTFPATPGEYLTVNVIPDLNEKRKDETQ